MESNNKAIENKKDCDNSIQELNKLVVNIGMKIRGNNRGWLGKEGMCEVCGLRRAVVNLDLSSGSHRECRSCWDD